MKSLIMFLAFYVGAAHAVINLDQPISVGHSDKVYRSAADAQAAYLFPTTLAVLNTPRLADISGEIRAFFDVGMDPALFQEAEARVKSMNLSLRTMRGLQANIDIKGSTDTPTHFRSRLEPLGDAGAIGSPLPYMFAVKKIGPKLGKESYKLMKELFHSPSARHLGTIQYEFNAVLGGKPYLGKTSVGVFAVNLANPQVGPKGIQIFSNAITSDGAVDQPRPIQILLDKNSNCWETVQIGQICLR